MKNYHTTDEIDEIGEGLVRKYQFQSFVKGMPTDIEGFIRNHLKYQIIYDRLADRDAGKMAFLADGKTPLWVWRNGSRVQVVPQKGQIIVDVFLGQRKNTAKKRFVLAHEAGHIIMDRLSDHPTAAAYNNEFDGQRTYTFQELAELFSTRESKATAMGVALLMPKSLVVGHLRAMMPDRRIPLYGNSVIMDGDRAAIMKMAEHFQVSFKSMFYRLRDLKLFEPRDIDEYLALTLGDMGGTP